MPIFSQFLFLSQPQAATTGPFVLTDLPYRLVWTLCLGVLWGHDCQALGLEHVGKQKEHYL